jgi:hypothetical protein
MIEAPRQLAAGNLRSARKKTFGFARIPRGIQRRVSIRIALKTGRTFIALSPIHPVFPNGTKIKQYPVKSQGLSGRV